MKRVLAFLFVSGLAMQAHARDVENYNYEAVCKVTRAYINDLDEYIERKEWGDIRKRAGRTREPGYYRYKNRDFAVEYDMLESGKPMVARVHFQKARVPDDMLSQAEFMQKFDVTAADKAAQMTLYCDTQLLEARFSGGRMTDFIVYTLSDV